MKIFGCFTSVIVVSIVYTCTLIEGQKNDRPIIGVITQESNKYKGDVIIASYVKFLEAGGSRVVPVRIRKPKKYYEDLMGKINGVLFPGGGDSKATSNGYGRTAEIVLHHAVKLNKNKQYFPVWGTCLGFEFLNYIVAGKNWTTACSESIKVHPIKLSKDYKESRMFRNIDPQLKNIMENKDVAFHYHHWCLTPENYTKSGLDKFFRILSVNDDTEKSKVIAIIEAIDFPFYGVSFHPEKVLFEWKDMAPSPKIPHHEDAVRVAQYFTNFFVSEARKSMHSFPSKSAEDKVLIYNYKPKFTGKTSSFIEQRYIFKKPRKHHLRSVMKA